MKYCILYILALLLPSSINHLAAQTQNNFRIIDKGNYFASYNYEYQEDSATTSSRKQEVMWLIIGNEYSKFGHNSLLRLDSMVYNSKDPYLDSSNGVFRRQMEGDAFSFLTQYRIIKERNTSKTDLIEYIRGKHYKISDHPVFNWKIKTNKDTIIAGYKCLEALTEYRGRQYRAWYTLDIPVSEGPFKFKGLPGLILKLEDTRRHHCFELISFKKVTQKPIYLGNKNYIQLDPSQYPKLKKNESLERAGISNVVNIEPEKLGSIQAKTLNRNNIIEKY